jgi:hypothetical protein
MPAAAIKTATAAPAEKGNPTDSIQGKCGLPYRAVTIPWTLETVRVSRTGTRSLASYLAASCRSTGRTDGSGASDRLSARAASIGFAARMTRECTRSTRRASFPDPPCPAESITAGLLPTELTSLGSTSGCIVAAATRESPPVHVVKLPAVQIEVLEQSQACLHELSESHDSDGTDVFIYCNYLISPPSCIP